MERAVSGQLADHRGVWERKPILRLIYENFYDRIALMRMNANNTMRSSMKP
jgi:hypothetical protein